MVNQMDKALFGAGIDIVEIDRIAKAIDRHGERFLRRIFTQSEIEYCSNKARPAENFAARFAAKEAVFKAAGGEENLWFTQIEILRAERGRPVVRLINTQKLSGEEFVVSISHSHNYASAVALRIPR